MFFEIAKEVLENTRESIFVAHNVNFDFNVIKNEYKELAIPLKGKNFAQLNYLGK